MALKTGCWHEQHGVTRVPYLCTTFIATHIMARNGVMGDTLSITIPFMTSLFYSISHSITSNGIITGNEFREWRTIVLIGILIVNVKQCCYLNVRLTIVKYVVFSLTSSKC